MPGACHFLFDKNGIIGNHQGLWSFAAPTSGKFEYEAVA